MSSSQPAIRPDYNATLDSPPAEAIAAKGRARYDEFRQFKVTNPFPHVAHVQINRPKKLNAFNAIMWRECRELFQRLAKDSSVRAIVLSANGKVFTAGLDLAEMGDIVANTPSDFGRAAWDRKQTIQEYQDSFTAIENCPKPVLVAIHGACIGAGVDMVTACDIRFCTKDAFFSVKEVDVGLAADVGTLQRLPKVIKSESLVRELCFTARKLKSEEAGTCGLVSRVFPDRKQMVASALSMAKVISEKSPIAVQGTKLALIFSRDHSVKEGLEWIKIWNMSMLATEDIPKAVGGFMTKQKPLFSKL